MKSRITQLDGIRAFAILAVFMHHALHAKLLWMGVDLFFVLSGFLITAILMSRKEKGDSYFGYFYARRARRIIPPYVLILVVASFIDGLEWMKHWPWYALFMMNLGVAMGRMPADSPLWSLAVEEQFYFIWPFVVLLIPTETIGLFAAGIIVVAPVLRAVATHHLPNFQYIYLLTPFRMDTLAAGALLAWCWKFHFEWFERFGKYAWALVIGGIAGLGLCSRFPVFFLHANTVPANVIVLELTLITCFGAVVLALSATGLVKTLLNWYPLRYIGIISYSVYLVHLLVLREVGKHLHTTFAVFFVGLLLSLVYASVSWFGMERLLVRTNNTTSPQPLDAHALTAEIAPR